MSKVPGMLGRQNSFQEFFRSQVTLDEYSSSLEEGDKTRFFLDEFVDDSLRRRTKRELSSTRERSAHVHSHQSRRAGQREESTSGTSVEIRESPEELEATDILILDGRDLDREDELLSGRLRRRRRVHAGVRLRHHKESKDDVLDSPSPGRRATPAIVQPPELPPPIDPFSPLRATVKLRDERKKSIVTGSPGSSPPQGWQQQQQRQKQAPASDPQRRLSGRKRRRRRNLGPELSRSKSHPHITGPSSSIHSSSAPASSPSLHLADEGGQLTVRAQRQRLLQQKTATQLLLDVLQHQPSAALDDVIQNIWKFAPPGSLIRNSRIRTAKALFSRTRLPDTDEVGSFDRSQSAIYWSSPSSLLRFRFFFFSDFNPFPLFSFSGSQFHTFWQW